MIVLDSSALLAFLLREPGGEAVASEMRSAIMSAANVAEVLSRFALSGDDPAAYLGAIRRLGVEIAHVTDAHALDAARLRPLTRSRGLSLGDRLCLALARERACAVMTADHNWSDLDLGVDVIQLR